jgi:hypothetical protein
MSVAIVKHLSFDPVGAKLPDGRNAHLTEADMTATAA